MNASKTKSMDLKEDLKALRDNLPYGAVQRIADKLGRSRYHVGAVLRQKYHDDEVINLAIKEIQEDKKRKQDISQKIRKAITS